MNPKETYRAGLYCRLSKDDDQQGESVSIATQRAILSAHCQEQGYEIHDVYIDDGYSGLNFERPIETFQTGKGRKGRTLVAFTCRRGIISYLFHLTVFPNGRVDIRLSPSNADSIGYDGELEEKP